MAIGLRERFLVGGTGGAIPILVNFSSIDPQSIIRNFDRDTFFGYFVVAIILFILGGIVAYFMRSENEHWKLFVIGMTAPAMLTGINNARLYNNTIPEKQSVSSENSSPTVGQGTSNHKLRQSVQVAQIAQVFDFVQMPLVAQGESNTLPGSTIEVRYAIPRKGRFDKFLRGLLGIRVTPPSWFVIDSKFEADSQELASQRRRQLEEIFVDHPIDVTVVRNPYEGSEDKYYVLLGGEDITSRPKTKYILDKLRPVLFSSTIKARTVAMEAARLVDEHNVEIEENSIPTEVLVIHPK